MRVLRLGWRDNDTTASAIYNRGHTLHGLCSNLNVTQSCICFFFQNGAYVCFSWMLQPTESSEITSAGVISRGKADFPQIPTQWSWATEALAARGSTGYQFTHSVSRSFEAVQWSFLTRRFQISRGKCTTISEINSCACVVCKNWGRLWGENVNSDEKRNLLSCSKTLLYSVDNKISRDESVVNFLNF